MIKKWICSILVFVMLFSSLSIVNAQATPDVVRSYESEKAFLEKAGIIISDYTNSESITRGEFIKLVLNAFYPVDVFIDEISVQSVFTDVASNHLCYSEIKAAKDMGIINGSGDGTFRPDDDITLSEAVIVAVNALGYNVYGGESLTLAFYHNIARQKNLLDEINDDFYSKLKIDTAFKLIYNSLFAELLKIDNISNDGIEITNDYGSNILGLRYNIYKYSLYITDNGITSLVGSSINSTEKVVARNNADNTYLTLNLNGTRLNEEIGRNVTAYIKNKSELDRYDVVYYELENAVSEICIYTHQIINVTSNYIEYEIDSETGKSKKVNYSKSPYVVYNGMFINRYDPDIFKTKDGIIYAVDNNGDGKAELIELYSFNFKKVKNNYGDIDQSNSARNIVVSSVDTENQYISCKINSFNNIDLNDDEYMYRIYGGKQLSDITEDMIVSVAQAPHKISGKTFYTLFLSDSVISGTVDSKDTTQASLYIDGREIKVSGSLTGTNSNYINALNTGIDIKALADITGKIAYIYDLSTVTNNYAYLISAGVTSGPDGCLKLKLFLKNGEIEELEVNSKAQIDGVSVIGGYAQLTALTTRPANYEKLEKSEGIYYENSISRPLIFKVNSENLVTVINTDTPDYPTDTTNLNLYSDHNAIGYSNEEIYDSDTLKAGYRSHKIGRYNKTMNTLSQKFFIDSETVIMKVPDIDTSGLNNFSSYVYSNYSSNNIAALDYKMIEYFEEPRDDDNYKILNYNDLSETIYYDIQGYNINPDTGIAELVVIRGKSDMTEYTSGDMDLCIFLRKTKAYDSEKEKMVTKIYYTVDGVNELSALIDTDELLFAYDYIISGSAPSENYYGDDIPEIKVGDMIRIVKNGTYLSHIERVYILSQLKTMPASITYPTITAGYRNTSTSASRLYDVNSTYRQINTTYNFYAVYPKDIRNGFVYGFMGTEAIGDVNPKDVKTFTDHYFKLNDSSIVVVDINNGGNIKVREGKLADIKTFDQNGGKLEGTSLVLYKHINYNIKQIFVINGLK